MSKATLPSGAQFIVDLVNHINSCEECRTTVFSHLYTVLNKGKVEGQR